MDKQRKIAVCLSPALISLYDIRNSTVVIIDIFRASSSMCYGISNGAEAIIPVAEVSSCAVYKDSDYLLAAERNGEVVDGFDFGNSPFSYTSEKVSGKTIVLTTTNGTKAIHLSREARQIVVGSFLNISALANWLSGQENDVILVCAGWKDNFSLEDSLFAGALLSKVASNFTLADDAAHATLDLFHVAEADIPAYLSKSAHSERLKKLNVEADIAFCLQTDLVDAIPVLKEDRLVKL